MGKVIKLPYRSRSESRLRAPHTPTGHGLKGGQADV